MDSKKLLFKGEIESTCEARIHLMTKLLDLLSADGFEIHPFYDRLILDELISNSVHHGNQSVPSKRVSAELYSLGKSWQIVLEDEGSGFDWQKQLNQQFDQHSQSELLSCSGRGIQMVASLGVKLHYTQNGARVEATRPQDLTRDSRQK